MPMDSAALRATIGRLREHSKVTSPVQVLESIRKGVRTADPTAMDTLS
ncbi:hypothetical protein J14TS5_19480 [Paenibacillus lautus]|nr:hypothetical protein [Paenibacillus lautus]GIO96862.1 hypothetical protein J14TS5_19480 [Paenibacillus lautus]